jgi:hypothetical protein
MRLKYLTLNKIVDTAYLCGINNTPVYVILAAPPGSGKTWSTCALEDVDFVHYINMPSSPSEHRKMIGVKGPRTRLLINDDLGLTARWNQAEYFSTFCMIADGKIAYKQFKTLVYAKMNCSLLLCCTTDYFYAHYDEMTSGGLFDRLTPIVLGLSNETRTTYQKYIEKSSIYTVKPYPRYPIFADERIVKSDLISTKNISPRMLVNIRRLSQYLTEEETDELVSIAHAPDSPEYEI